MPKITASVFQRNTYASGDTAVSQDTTAATFLMFYHNILSPRLVQVSQSTLHFSFRARVVTYMLARVFVKRLLFHKTASSLKAGTLSMSLTNDFTMPRTLLGMNE